MRNETLILSEARRRNVPYAPWDRESRCVFIDELHEMATEQLRALRDDLRILNGQTNQQIATENALLAQCQASTPMASREIRKRISRLIAHKGQVKKVMVEADRLIRDRNREANKPKPKKQPICMNQADHNELSGISRKLQSLKMKALFPVLRQIIGAERFGELEAQASAVAIATFKEWALTQEVRPEWVEHLVSAEESSMRKLAERLSSPLS